MAGWGSGRCLIPDAFQHAAVLGSVKDKPFGGPGRRAFLDRPSACRLSEYAGRDGRKGSAGGTNKRKDLKEEVKATPPALPTQNSEEAKFGMLFAFVLQCVPKQKR